MSLVVVAWALAGVAQSFAAEPAPPLAPLPGVVTDPVWISKPNGQDIDRLYPQKAKTDRKSGTVTLSCAIKANGELEDCRALSAKPEGYGFDAAALSMAGLFQMRPKAKDGTPVAGKTIRIPLTFRDVDDVGRTTMTLVTNPPWRRTPTPAMVKAAYPPKAADVDEGAAVIRCAFEADGRTKNCLIQSQTPAGKGFGPAAKALAANFVVRGDVFEGGVSVYVADIPFTFRNPKTAAPEGRIAKPEWVSTLSPTGAELLFPKAARAAGVFDGFAVVNCAAGPIGELVDCHVTKEQPVGLEFGAAVLEASKQMSLNPWTKTGEPAEGRRVNLSLRLKLDQPPPAAAPAKP